MPTKKCLIRILCRYIDVRCPLSINLKIGEVYAPVRVDDVHAGVALLALGVPGVCLVRAVGEGVEAVGAELGAELAAAGVGDHAQAGGHAPVAAGAAHHRRPLRHALGHHQVRGRPARVQTRADVEGADIELEVTLIEPHVVQPHVEAPGPRPRQTLLLVLDHVDPGGGGEVRRQEAEVAAAGAEVHDGAAWGGEVDEGPGQAGQLPALPLQSVRGQAAWAS